MQERGASSEAPRSRIRERHARGETPPLGHVPLERVCHQLLECAIELAVIETKYDE